MARLLFWALLFILPDKRLILILFVLCMMTVKIGVRLVKYLSYAWHHQGTDSMFIKASYFIASQSHGTKYPSNEKKMNMLISAEPFHSKLLTEKCVTC